MKSKDESHFTASLRPPAKYIHGEKVFACFHCHDTGMRYIEVELLNHGTKHTSTRPCDCDFGVDIQRQLNEGKADCFRVLARIIRNLPFSPYSAPIETE